ncbi:MAG: hypothetical protein WKI04_15805 [Ferruginibacter sp.]
MEQKADTFVFSTTAKPDLVNVDADKVLLWDKKDNKPAEDLIFQFKNAPAYLDRKEAIDFFGKKSMPELSLGLTDKFAGLRKASIDLLARSKFATDGKVIETIESIANNDKDKKTKAAALKFLAETTDAKYLGLFNKYVSDSSYSVSGAALEGLMTIEPAKSYELAKKHSVDAKGVLADVVSAKFSANGKEEDFDFIANRYNDAPPSQEKIEMTEAFCEYLAKVNDVNKVKKGVDYILKFRGFIPEHLRGMLDGFFKAGLNKVSQSKPVEVSEYINKSFK